MVQRRRKGQGTLEYILLITAVLVVLIALLGGAGGGFFGNKMSDTLKQPMNGMEKMSNTFSNYSKYGL